MSKDCKREPFPPLVPGPDPCSPPPPPPPPGSCGCGPWPYMSPPSPVLSVPGNSLYDSMMCLNQKVDTCIRAYNDVIARGYETLRNMEGANEAQGSFYNNKEITPISGYSPTDSSAYQLYKKQVLDCEGQPIRMEFRYGYDNVTNNGVKEGIFDAGRMVDADIIFPCQPDGDKVTGILYFKGKPVEGQVDPGFQNGFTVGFSRAGVMRVYPNTTDPHQLFLDEIENSAGCAGVLILEGKKVSAEMIEAIPDSAETRQRVCIGQNGYTREVYILTCKDEDTVPGQVGLTSDECANILLERGCTIAVEIAENNSGVLVNKGQLYQGSLDLSALDFNGFWYISKRCRYRNDYQSELADLYYDFGESLNNFRLQTSELKNLYDQLNQETQDRIAADNALSERIDDLTGRIDGLVDEMKNYTDNQIAALTLRLTDKTLLLPYVQKSGDSMQGALDMGDNKITSSYVPAEDADITNKEYVDTVIGNQHTADEAQFVDVAGDTMTGPLDMGANKVTSSATPTEENDLVNRKFTENQYVNTSGDTMTGPLAMGAQKITTSYNPQAGEDLTNKAYVDAGLNEKLSLSGGTMTGNILMGGNKVVSSAAPVSGDDLTNKDYVDSAIGNQHTADAEQFVDVSGDTMTGALDMGANKITSSYTPTDDNDLTNKTFVDTELSKQKSELEGEIAQAIENVTNGTTPISGVVKTDGSTPLTATWNAGQKITGIPEPTADGDAANKKYVDDAVSGAGGGDVTQAGNNTFTGQNTFNNPVTVGTPTADAHAATKAYVDSRPGGGGGDVTQAGNNTFTGQNTFNNPVTVGTPTADDHAATKKYTDDLNTSMGTRVSGLETEVDGLAAEIEGIDPAGLLKADGSVALTAPWVTNNTIKSASTGPRYSLSPNAIELYDSAGNVCGRISTQSINYVSTAYNKRQILSCNVNLSYISLYDNGKNFAFATDGEKAFISSTLTAKTLINLEVADPVEDNDASTKGYVDQRFQKITLTPSAGNAVLGNHSLYYNGNKLSGRIAINQSTQNVINFNVNPAPSWLTEILYGTCFYSSTSSIGGVADIFTYSLQASGILQLNLSEVITSTHYIYFS